jgi:iron complex outermembrane recepter protein
MRHTPLREAIVRVLRATAGRMIAPAVAGSAALAAMSLLATPALAQDAPADTPSQNLETITVTGTRIRRADVENAQPIIVLDRATIEHQGFTSVADILQNLSEAGSPPISRANALAAGEDVGGFYIDLRNLGNNRTLVLLNGKRLGATTSGAQDLGQIPTSVIERIEVLKDGASSLYGSDAIAGVVNIITRRNFDGAQASAYVGQYSQGDGDRQQYDITIGTHSEQGSITVSAQYTKDDPVFAKDRKFSRYPQGPYFPNSGWTPVSQWGGSFFPDGSCPGQNDSPYDACTLNPGGDPFNLNDYHGTNAAGGTSDLSNPNEEMYLQMGTERRGIYANAEWNFTNNLKFSTDLLYNKRSTYQQIAGYPYQSAAFGIPLSSESYYNPFDEDIDFLRRGWEHPRQTQSDLQTYRYAGTFEGAFDMGEHTYNWDVGGYVNTNDSLKRSQGDFSLIALQGALGPSFLDPTTGLVTCGTQDNPLPYGTAPGSCIPWNPLLPAGQGGSGSLSNAALQALLFPEYHDIGRTKTVDYSANITGPVFALPAGDLGVAVGYEHRNESGKFVPDAYSQSGQSTNLSSGPTSGRYKVDEFYAEIDVPVVKDVPFAKSLSFDIAARWSDYDSFGNTTNGKFSVQWRPIDDLLVRGNYAEGFRAPTIADLFGGLSGTFSSYTDPCDTVGGAAATNPDVAARCSAGFGGQAATPSGFRQPGQGGQPCSAFPCQTGVQFLSGANPALKPETATTKTLGIVYSPAWLEGIDVSVDWFRVHIDNAIAADSEQDVLDDCYLRGDASRCAQVYFTRDPATGGIVAFLTGNTNKGYVETEGYDFGVNYRFPEFSFGHFVVHWNSTYIDHLNVASSDDSSVPIEPLTGIGSNFRLRSNLGLDWTYGDFGATWSTRYYSSITERCSHSEVCNDPDHVAPDTGAQPQNRTGANTFHDVQVRWTAPWKGTISVGANNVFDHLGPILYTQPNSNFDYYGGFDIGRFYYVRYQQTF